MYKKLTVWQKSILFVKDIYRVTRDFPEEEKYGLVSQLRRAAVSIPSNIAEGKSRNTDKEFKQFLYMARGSNSEIETQLIIANELGFINQEDFDNLFANCNEIGKLLTSFIKKISNDN